MVWGPGRSRRKGYRRRRADDSSGFDGCGLGRPGDLVTGGVLSPNLGSFVCPFSEVPAAVVADPIIGCADRGQKRAVRKLEVIKGISASGVGVLILVLYVVDSNSHDAIAAIPAALNFELHPLAIRGLRADENSGN